MLCHRESFFYVMAIICDNDDDGKVVAKSLLYIHIFFHPHNVECGAICGQRQYVDNGPSEI